MNEAQSLIQLKNNDKEQVEIIFKSKKNLSDPYFEKYMKDRMEYVNKLNSIKKEKYEKIIKKYRLFDKMVNSIFLIFTSDKSYEKIILDEKIYDTPFDNIMKLIDEPQKYNNIYFSISNSYTNTNKYFQQKEILAIISLLLCYQYLQKGGSYLFTSTFLNYNLIKFAYLSTLFFEKVYIIEKSTVFLFGFKNDLSKIQLLIQIIKNHYQFELKNMIDLNNLVENIKKYIDIDIFLKKELYLYDNIDLYKKYTFIKKINLIQNLGLDIFKDFEKELIQYYHNININKDNKNFNELIIYNREFEYMKNMIIKYHLNTCLEVGFTYQSLSELFKDTKIEFISISDNQNRKNQSKENESIMQVYSKLLLENKKFDFILLNDKVNFDFILFYFVYSDKILNTNGYIIINNSHINSVSLCVKYIELNFTNYEKISTFTTMTIFKKKNDNKRDPNFFIPFCS